MGDPNPARSLGHLLDTVRDPCYKWRMCHLDGVVLDDEANPVRLLESKTSSAYRSQEWGDEDTDEVPEEYVIQCQHNAGVFKAAHKLALPVDLMALIGGQKFRVYNIAYRESLDEKLLGMERLFWDRVQEEDAPEPTERDAPALARLYPEDEGEEKVIGPESSLNSLAMHLSEVKEEEKRVQAARAQAEVNFKAEMKDLAKMIGDGWQVTWKQTKDSVKVDWEAAFKQLAKDFIELDFNEVDAHVAEIESAHTQSKDGYRRFTFRFDKEGD
jgi:predicted phage-related endonuclease